MWTWPGSVIVWLWDLFWSDWLEANDLPSSPVPVFVLDQPLTNWPLRSGRLKVEEPSPDPHVVEIVANKASYVDLLTAAPLHSKYPEGTVVVAKLNTEPTGTPLASSPQADPLYPSKPAVVELNLNRIKKILCLAH